MRAFKIRSTSAPIVVLSVALFAAAVYLLVHDAAPSDMPPSTLALLLAGFVLLIGSLRTRQR